MSNTVSAYPCKPDIDCHPVISSHVTHFQTGEIDLPRQRTGARPPVFRFAPQVCPRKPNDTADAIPPPLSFAFFAKIVSMVLVIGVSSLLSAQAAPSCGLEKWLTNLNAAANSYANALGTPDQVSAERVFRQQMERYSRDQLVNQINEAGLSANKAALESFIVARRHLYDLSRDNWGQMATRYGTDPRFASQSQAMSNFLQETECDPYAEDFLNDTRTKHSVLERIQSAVSSLAEASKTPVEIETVPSTLMFNPDNFDDYRAPRYQPKTDTAVIPLSPSQNAPIYLGLFTFFVSASIWVWMRIGLAQRRAIRYSCTLPIVIFDGGAPILGALRDLSQLGAKLESGLVVKPKSKLLITINETKRQARVIWTNQHFIGLEFDKALSETELTDILKGFSAQVAASHMIAGGFETLLDDVYGSSAITLTDYLTRSGADQSTEHHLAEDSEIDEITIRNVSAPKDAPEKTEDETNDDLADAASLSQSGDSESSQAQKKTNIIAV
jgi:hypothetical protein